MIEFFENFNTIWFEMIDFIALSLPFCFTLATLMLLIVLCIKYLFQYLFKR
jgi:hypothetical protein